jgi:hypothetical protein
VIWTRAESNLLGDTGCSCRHYSISRIVFFLPSLDSIIARRRPLRAQYERTPRHCKRELLGCIIRNDTVLPFYLMIFKRFIYIYQKLKQAQTFWWVGVVRISKSQRSLARCPLWKLGFGNAERHGRSLGFRHSNRLPQLYLFPVHRAIFLYIGFAPVPAGSSEILWRSVILGVGAVGAWSSGVWPSKATCHSVRAGDLEWPVDPLGSWGHIGPRHHANPSERAITDAVICNYYYLHTHLTLQ